MTDDARPSALRAELTAREKDALAFQAVMVLGAVPDLAVALVRSARRERGIQLGPTAATLALAAVAPAWGRRALRARGPAGVAARLGLLAAVPVLPLSAGAVRATVIGRGHPLWQLAASAAVRVVSGAVTVLPAARAVARRRREAPLRAA
ncbi:hypothetical protein [Blastococcus litoris]|uniref:hypothetical protein n=1 Tax=Blastococcus litoris TaxID=2171622 RepID=UPI000E300A96|nr:hypothetical protein [Blastococcus litoris]